MVQPSAEPHPFTAERLEGRRDTHRQSVLSVFSVDKIIRHELHVRAVPAELIKEIQTADNDVHAGNVLHCARRSTKCRGRRMTRTQSRINSWSISPKRAGGHLLGRAGPGSHAAMDRPLFSTWLEDRARLNHFRNSIMYILRLKGSIAQGEKDRRAAESERQPAQARQRACHG